MSTLKTASLQHPDASSNTIHLSASGNVGIGTNSPTAKLDLGGNNVAGVSSINGGQVGGRRNLIINGSMQVAQRGTSATSVSTEGYKTVDRYKWTMDSTSSVYTLSQSTDVPSGQGFAKSFKAETTTADASLDAGCQIRFETRFEGQDLQQLCKGTSNAKSVTLSFWVKAFQTGTYVINLQDTDNSRLIAATYTVNSSATWEYKTITFVGDTTGAFTDDNNLSLVVHWYLGAGSTYTSGTLATSWESLTNANRAVGQTVDVASSTSNYWAITGVQLEVGTSATTFEHRSYGDELSLCQRYYWRGAVAAGGCFGGNGTVPLVGFMFPVAMRTTPSGSYISGGIASNGTADYTVTGAYSTFMIRATNQSSRLLFNQSGSASGADGCDLSGAVCAFDAEL